MNPRNLAQEIVSWYFDHYDVYVPHSDNVDQALREPVIAMTCSMLKTSSALNGDVPPPPPVDCTDAVVPEEIKTAGSDWRTYLEAEKASANLSEITQKMGAEAYNSLCRRARARLDAFLDGVVLAVASDSEKSAATHSDSESETSSSRRKGSVGESESHSVSLNDGLAGFRSVEKPRLPGKSFASSSSSIIRSISNGRKAPVLRKCPQIAEENLLLRLELYIRSLHRVKVHKQDCVVAAEPVRAVKARVEVLVTAFVETVGTVRQQGPVLTNLLAAMTKELLAVEKISDSVAKMIRKVVTDYEHATSFASLAFLSSPEKGAYQQLTPRVLKFIRYLQVNWENCVLDCERERMLSLAIDPYVRHTFKTIEFRSIGHLLEVCQSFRKELQRIELAPGVRGTDEMATDNDAIRQAIRDLKREVITINGSILPPVKSRRELIGLLSQTLNSRALTGRIKANRKKVVRRSESAPVLHHLGASDSDDFLSSGQESDYSNDMLSSPGSTNSLKGRAARRRNFRLSTVDLLTKRLLLAAGRTGTGGDAYFVVHDLFGGDDVEVVPSSTLPSHQRLTRAGTIEISVRLASLTIHCHASFDVYPKSLVGECEPLIQIHTTTTETIGLQEVRASDSMNDCKEDCYSSDEGEDDPVMVVQERKTDRTGWRVLSIRPALYEKVESWNTPS